MINPTLFIQAISTYLRINHEYRAAWRYAEKRAQLRHPRATAFLLAEETGKPSNSSACGMLETETLKYTKPNQTATTSTTSTPAKPNSKSSTTHYTPSFKKLQTTNPPYAAA